MAGPLLRVEGLCKSYDAVRALDGVSLSLEEGEVHGLVGENGAGKSTLIKVLTGVVAPDDGAVEFLGAPLPLGDAAACERAGIAAVHQESTAFRDLGLAENLFVGKEPRKFGVFLDRAAMKRAAQEQMARVGETAPYVGPLGDASLARQQMVAIARAVSSGARLVVFDEPTASLSVKEAEAIHREVRALRASGACVLYVSHRLEEVMDLCDRVTAMRDGRVVATMAAAQVTRDALIRAMVGRDVERSVFASGKPAEVRLEVRGLSRPPAFSDVSFQVRSGEVVGLGGLVGAGRSEIVRAVFGVDPVESGTVMVEGKPLHLGDVRESVRAGLSLVPEDRQHEGLVTQMSLATNVALALRPSLSTGGFIAARREREVVEEQSRDLQIKSAGPDAPVSSLSGGNQQKASIAKWLATKPRVLVLDEPTRGVDVGAKAEIHRIVRSLADQGTAVLVVSSDLPELLALSDRVVVVRSGRVVGELSREDATPERFLKLAIPEGA